jgi:hypothetical protein
MVSLTLMLVIATISASIQQSLPATPYYKMIDIWLFFSMNLMVYSLSFHTYLQHIIKKNTVLNLSNKNINNIIGSTSRVAFSPSSKIVPAFKDIVSDEVQVFKKQQKITYFLSSYFRIMNRPRESTGQGQFCIL